MYDVSFMLSEIQRQIATFVMVLFLLPLITKVLLEGLLALVGVRYGAGHIANVIVFALLIIAAQAALSGTETWLGSLIGTGIQNTFGWIYQLLQEYTRLLTY